MISLALAALASTGAYLIVVRSGSAPLDSSTELVRDRWTVRVRAAYMSFIRRLDIGDVPAAHVVTTSIAAGAFGATVTYAVFASAVPSLLVGLASTALPCAVWRRRRQGAREAARDAWPRLIEELRVLTGSAGRPIPQAFLEVGLRGPVEMRPAFEAAQREWLLTTDFERTVQVLRRRLADPTADATCEMLLIAAQVGGDLDERLRSLAEDRRHDLISRKDAHAKQAGARLARSFVVLVPAGMAFAGLSVGTGQAAYQSARGQLLVAVGIALVVLCWTWAGRVMRLPDEDRVFRT